MIFLKCNAIKHNGSKPVISLHRRKPRTPADPGETFYVTLDEKSASVPTDAKSLSFTGNSLWFWYLDKPKWDSSSISNQTRLLGKCGNVINITRFQIVNTVTGVMFWHNIVLTWTCIWMSAITTLDKHTSICFCFICHHVLHFIVTCRTHFVNNCFHL